MSSTHFLLVVLPFGGRHTTVALHSGRMLHSCLECWPPTHVNQPIELAAFHPPRLHLGRRGEPTYGVWYMRCDCTCRQRRILGAQSSLLSATAENGDMSCLSNGYPTPSAVIGHSARGVATPWAAMRGVSLALGVLAVVPLAATEGQGMSAIPRDTSGISHPLLLLPTGSQEGMKQNGSYECNYGSVNSRMTACRQ